MFCDVLWFLALCLKKNTKLSKAGYKHEAAGNEFQNSL